MTKRPRLSIAAATPAEVEEITTSQRDDAVTSQRDNVGASHGFDVATSQRQTKRKPLSHSSFYASPRVLKALREIALARDCKVNDLVCEGLRIILARNGRDFDTLNIDQ